MDVSQGTESREVVERLQEWIQEGPDLYLRLLDHLHGLQEQAAGGHGEITHWQRLAEAAKEESERLRLELEALRIENEQLRKQQEEWDAVVGSVDETTRRMNDMIGKLRASRRKVL
jgi:FtsZ-binding cell division protein ZapB